MTDIKLKMLSAIRDLSLKHDRKYVKSNLVIGEVARATGIYEQSLENSLRDETWDSQTMIELYDVLIELVLEGDLVVGQGNFGNDYFGAAHPQFTECFITEAGLQILKQTR